MNVVSVDNVAGTCGYLVIGINRLETSFKVTTVTYVVVKHVAYLDPLSGVSCANISTIEC